MKQLLIEISAKAVKNKEMEFASEQVANKWLGNAPATEKEILDAEARLGVKLPEDYKQFLAITNGFSAPSEVDPSFENVSEIDFLKNTMDYLVEAYEHLPELETAIIVGGKTEEQHFLLLPPQSEGEAWGYWRFANWIPGEEPFENLTSYFENVLEFIGD